MAVIPGVSIAAGADGAAPAPFFRHREAILGYQGPSEDFNNLIELRIGWFGPTNLADPLTGDLWWAVNYAIQEANAQLSLKSEVRSPNSERNSKPETRSPQEPACSGQAAPQALGQPGQPSLPTSDFGCRISDAYSLPFRLSPRWAVDPWGTGVSRLARMVYEEQPLALLGSVDSASTHLAEQVVAKAQLPLVSPITTDKTVTLAGVSWMFACAPSDAAMARVLVEEVLAGMPQSLRHEPPDDPQRPQGLQRSTLALLACTDHESRMTTREVLAEFSRRGRLPDFRFDVPPGAGDVSRQLTALREARPAVVLIVAGAEDSARLVRALWTPWTTNTVTHTPSLSPSGGEGARRAGEGEARPFLFGTHTLGRTRFLQLAGPAAEGVRFPLLFVPDATDPATARFMEQFTGARGHAPDYAAALTYDATRLLVAAIRRAGPNRARIREALHQLSPWQGIAGLIAFDGTGQNTRTNLCMATMRNGAVVPILAYPTTKRTRP